MGKNPTTFAACLVMFSVVAYIFSMESPFRIFMSSCQEELKYYECVSMWNGTHYRR